MQSTPKKSSLVKGGDLCEVLPFPQQRLFYRYKIKPHANSYQPKWAQSRQKPSAEGTALPRGSQQDSPSAPQIMYTLRKLMAIFPAGERPLKHALVHELWEQYQRQMIDNSTGAQQFIQKARRLCYAIRQKQDQELYRQYFQPHEQHEL